MRFGLITTLDTNIGDDLIRAGVIRVLDAAFAGPHSYELVNKHRPLTILRSQLPSRFVGAFPIRFERRLAKAAGRLLTRMLPTRFDDVDAVVQCGTPVFWPECFRCEWRETIWEGVVARRRNRVPTLNLAAGSSYPDRSPPSSIDDPRDREYLGNILDWCAVTTVRDPLAQRLAGDLGHDVEEIPCAAFLAAPGDLRGSGAAASIIVNYMQGGGHFDWSQNVDGGRWRSTVQELVGRLRERHPVVFLCHNEREVELAREIDPTVETVLPRTVAEYFEVVKGARAGVCNRLHASVALAGAGIPSVAIGTDTRMAMVAALGLPTHFVEDTDAQQLEREVEELASSDGERDRLAELRSHVMARYIDVVRRVLG